MLEIEILRYKRSKLFRYSKKEIRDNKLNEYQARTKNNMLDDFILWDNNINIFQCKVQTISNHPLMKYTDSLRAGKFELKCFVDQRSFNTPIHGIINAYDLAGQKINQYSMQNDNGQYIGRWLMHSSYYAPLGHDTKAYSGGCIITTTQKMLKFNSILKEKNIKKNDIIRGLLKEV